MMVLRSLFGSKRFNRLLEGKLIAPLPSTYERKEQVSPSQT
jgi:hypothetical protein